MFMYTGLQTSCSRFVKWIQAVFPIFSHQSIWRRLRAPAPSLSVYTCQRALADTIKPPLRGIFICCDPDLGVLTSRYPVYKHHTILGPLIFSTSHFNTTHTQTHTTPPLSLSLSLSLSPSLDMYMFYPHNQHTLHTLHTYIHTYAHTYLLTCLHRHTKTQRHRAQRHRDAETETQRHRDTRTLRGTHANNP